MAHVLVKSGTIADGAISKLGVELVGIGARSLDRDTAIAWMKDGHSFVPMVGGDEGPALQLVGIDGDDSATFYIRTDNASEGSDSLPTGLPS